MCTVFAQQITSYYDKYPCFSAMYVMQVCITRSPIKKEKFGGVNIMFQKVEEQQPKFVGFNTAIPKSETLKHYTCRMHPTSLKRMSPYIWTKFEKSLKKE